MNILVFLALLSADAPISALPADLVEAHDGDTVRVVIHVPLIKIQTEPISVRCASYDAWEIDHTRQTVGVITDAEIERGKRARLALLDLIASGKLYLEPGEHPDPHGRLSAELWVLKDDGAWTRVSTWMKRHGHDRDSVAR